MSIFVLGLSLAALVPAPMSVCAMLAGLPAECQSKTPDGSTGPQPHCQGMGMAEPAKSVSAPVDASCCRLSEAPLPQAHKKAPAVEFAARLAVQAQPVMPALQPARTTVWNFLVDASPPDRQPLLCVFLI